MLIFSLRFPFGFQRKNVLFFDLIKLKFAIKDKSIMRTQEIN